MPVVEVELSNNIESIWEWLFKKGKEVDYSLVSVKAKFTAVNMEYQPYMKISNVFTAGVINTNKAV